MWQNQTEYEIVNGYFASNEKKEAKYKSFSWRIKEDIDYDTLVILGDRELY